MRPITLELCGFTSFRERVSVEFDKLGLFAITGQTGAGKTSLLDAMTWALYGKTARLSKAGRELVSQGANSVDVLLRFRAAGKEYQVFRRLKGSSSATARLEYRTEYGDWEPVTGSVREIDDRVRAIIGLDFDGFNKAVILPQGQFDLFLRGKAEERRAVLSELLDISVYQRMMQSANERAKTGTLLAEQKAFEVDDSISEESVSALQAGLESMRGEEKTWTAVLKKLDAVYQEAVELGSLRKQLTSGESALLTLGRELADAGKRKVAADEQVQSLKSTVAKAESDLEAIAYDANLHLDLVGKLPQLEQRDRCEKQLGAAQATVTELSARAAKALAARDQANATVAKEEEGWKAAKEAYERLHAMDRVTGLRSELKSGCVCPVCEQTVRTVPPVVDGKKLTAAKKAFDKSTEAVESAKKNQEKARLAAEAAERESMIARSTVEQLQKQLKSLPAMDQDLQSVRRSLDELKSAKDRREAAEKSLQVQRTKLRDNEMLAATESAKASSLEKQIEERRAANDGLAKQVDKAAAKIRKQFPELEVGVSEADWIRSRQAEARKNLDGIRERVMRTESEIARMREKLARNERLREEVAAHQREASEYKDLAQWLQAGNFQQFLLDSALERLGAEGSKHLKKLSANRYEFGFRDKEFLVRDAWHGGEERSVSTLSGGESFLASLALALALAEGVAQMNSESGRVVLESLFLDEGFSTLDPETLTLVADALTTLQSGDRLIGIITHVQGLADQMPARIEVEKSISGSRVSMESSLTRSAVGPIGRTQGMP